MGVCGGQEPLPTVLQVSGGWWWAGRIELGGMSKQLATMCLAGKQKFKVDDLEVYALTYR